MNTRRQITLSLLLIAFVSADAAAEAASDRSGYAGLQTRPIKALSDEQIADLRAGRGMGYALAAELNGYPGPVHVLEHAEALDLSPTQRRHTERLFREMQAEAVALGERLIGLEAELERLFAEGVADPATVEAASRDASIVEGALRATHLRYHLVMRDLLTAEQMRRYTSLRGYTGPEQGHGRGHGH
ncbi:MAG: hypothetical protein R3349_01640 [Geminicoccaceae bacterium]|nr:hypothetical protein [Geminicoccaceae bacterium]